ncbi:MAG: Xaa-Pro peptidase family protein [Chloroflexota bacterium]|nr:Xaa-Pro peptidase family protein [Chloroflexota bacterium]
MYTERLSHLIEQVRAHGLDALALVPGPNLFYLTGLSFHLSERPIIALLPVDAPPAIVLPALEAVKVGQATVGLDVFPYTDEEGHAAAFQSVCVSLALTAPSTDSGPPGIIGVELLRMRLLEVRMLERYAPGCRLVPAEEVLGELRMRKDEHELEQMRRAIGVTEAALRTTMCQVEAGMTEREVAALLTVEMLQAGGEEMAFSPIVVAGPNSASPHATPTDRPIRSGEAVIVDCGVTIGGYAADITRTFAIGGLEPELAQVYEIVRAANRAGLAAAGPGVPAEDVDRAARAVIESAGYGEHFFHRTGHGLGLEVHEPPFIVSGNRRILEPGMTFTVEPGVYLPGQGGVRIEDDVLVTPDGAESMTTFTREFISL